jgi:hypothetical protein
VESDPGVPSVARPHESLTSVDDAPVSESVIEQFVAQMWNGNDRDQLLDKLSQAQLGQILDQTERDADRSFKLQSQAIKVILFVVVVAALLVFGLCWLFLGYQKGDLLRELFILLLGIGSGGIGGFAGGRLTAPKADQ